MANVTLGGNPIEVGGTLPSVGAKAPAFTLVGKDLKDVSLADFAGKRKVLNIVPSLDTPVCATSTRKFNEAASKLDNTVVFSISADLPFAAALPARPRPAPASWPGWRPPARSPGVA